MNASDISERRFEKGFNGYRIDEVDHFLADVAEEFSRISEENNELLKKLEVLAEKIREYRNDEDALKEALLGAQKQGQLAIAQAKEKAQNILDEATSNRNAVLEDLEKESERINAENEVLISDAKKESERIINDANERAASIESDLNSQIEIQREILYRTKSETDEFRQRILNAFKLIEGQIYEIPDKCENDYIKKAYDAKAQSLGKETLKKGKKVLDLADFVQEAKESHEDDDDITASFILDLEEFNSERKNIEQK